MKRNLIAVLTGSLVVVAPMLTHLASALPSITAFPNPKVAQVNRAQLEQKRIQLQSQLAAIVTPAQREQFMAAIEQGQSVEAAIVTMDLSTDQKAQLQKVFAAAGLPNLAQLNLTPAQKAQLRQVSTQVRTQLNQVLTAAQRQQFKAELVQGNSIQGAIAAINLSTAQKAQVRQVMQFSRDQLNQILTAEQRQQLRQSLYSLQQQRQR